MVLVVAIFCSFCLCIFLSRSFLRSFVSFASELLLLLLFWFFVLPVLLRNIRRTAADSVLACFIRKWSVMHMYPHTQYTYRHTLTQISFIQMNEIYKKRRRRSPKEPKRKEPKEPRNFFVALVLYVFWFKYIIQFYVRFRFVFFQTFFLHRFISIRHTHSLVERTPKWCIQPMLISWYCLLLRHTVSTASTNGNRIVQIFPNGKKILNDFISKRIASHRIHTHTLTHTHTCLDGLKTWRGSHNAVNGMHIFLSLCVCTKYK